MRMESLERYTTSTITVIRMDCPYDTVPTMCDDCERIEPDRLRTEITTEELLDELVLRTKNVEGWMGMVGGDAVDIDQAKQLRVTTERIAKVSKALFAVYNGHVARMIEHMRSKYVIVSDEKCEKCDALVCAKLYYNDKRDTIMMDYTCKSCGHKHSGASRKTASAFDSEIGVNRIETIKV